MNLRNISVSLQPDGFAIIDPQSIIAPGTPLRVRYELASGWVSRDIEFEVTDRPTLFHPFRKRSMFVYTGDAPQRVIVLDPQEEGKAGWGTRMARTEFDRAAFFGTRNFQSWPAYDDSSWLDDDILPMSFGVIFDDVPPMADPVPASAPDFTPDCPPDPVEASSESAPDDSDDADPGDTVTGDEDGGEPNAY